MKILSALLFCLVLSSSDAQYDIITSILEVPLDILTLLFDILTLPFDILPIPFQILGFGGDEFCSSISSEDDEVTPNITQVVFEFRSVCNVYSYPMLKVGDILFNDEFYATSKTVILVTGEMNDQSETRSHIISVLSKAYNCRNDGYNFFALGLSENCESANTLTTGNIQKLGEYMAEGLEQLTQIVAYENVHLIAHGTGAHLVGVAARRFTELTGNKLKYITGLDPVTRCFNEDIEPDSTFSDNAEFVDIIHTTIDEIGEQEPLGHVDFYANGLSSEQPGCSDIGCSHAIAADYYAETVYPNNSNDTLATGCSSLEELEDVECKGEEIPMGFAVPQNVSGIYYVPVNAIDPYGMNASDDYQSLGSICGMCES